MIADGEAGSDRRPTLRLRAATSSLGIDDEPRDVELGRVGAILRGGRLWIDATDFSERDALRALGAALLWAVRNGTEAIGVVARDHSGVLARQADYFSLPVEVFAVGERGVVPAERAAHERVEPRGDHLVLAENVRRARADVVIEHGVVCGEVLGLEVCRVVDEDSGPRLRVGVGAHDRETFQMVHGDDADVTQLARVVAEVAEFRRDPAQRHPLARLAVERALRHRALVDPQRVGMRDLQPIEPPLRRDNVKDPVPCCATGTGIDGRPALVVFGGGLEPMLLPFAADAIDRVDRSAELIVATTEKSTLPTIAQLAASMRRTVTFVHA